MLDASFDIINEDKAPIRLRADNLIFRERIEPGSLLSKLNEIEDPKIKLKVAIGLNDNLIRNDRKGTLEIKKNVLIESGKIAPIFSGDYFRSDSVGRAVRWRSIR